MRLLLDTHTVLWALNRPERLSEAAREAIEDRSHELVCSAVIPWEIATKHRKGKLAEARVVLDAYREHLERLGAGELAISSRHALLAGRLDWTHGDPFDRMLAAQSILEGIPLVTSDRAFSTLPGVDVFW